MVMWIFAAHAGVDEFDDDFLADAFDVAIAPVFKGEGRGLAAAFFHGAFVGAARGMRLDFIGLAVHDVDAAAIGLPAGHAGGEMLVGVGDALVVLFLIFVLFGVGGGIAALPEGFNEVVALFVVRELLEGGALFVGDDVDDVLVEPLLVDLAHFRLERALILLALFLIDRAVEGIDGVGGRLGLRGAGGVFRGSVGGVALSVADLSADFASGWSWATAPQTSRPKETSEIRRTV